MSALARLSMPPWGNGFVLWCGERSPNNPPTQPSNGRCSVLGTAAHSIAAAFVAHQEGAHPMVVMPLTLRRLLWRRSVLHTATPASLVCGRRVIHRVRMTGASRPTAAKL